VNVTIDESAGADDATLDLLCACLRFDAQPGTSKSLAARIRAVGWERLLSAAEPLFLKSALLDAVHRLKLAPDVPAMTLPNGRMTVTKVLQQAEANLATRRGVFTERLGEIAEALNARAITPIALKGGASIVTGKPAWRYLRDLDLLVRPHEASRAQHIVQELGYRPAAQPRPRMLHHHLQELYRDDMPGWIEIHRRAGLSRVEQFLSSAEMVKSAVVPSEAQIRGVRVLPAHLHVLHGMIHHHIGHRAVKRAEIGVRGLYEFAAGVVDMSEDERAALVGRASRHPRFLAILDLWTAAAADLFGMPVARPLTMAPDALEWWSRIRSGDPEMAGTGPELRAATRTERMKRAIGGHSAARRTVWKLAMPLTFLKRPMLLKPPGFR
jgi:hypothetical protein